MAATAPTDNRSGILGVALQLFAARGYDAVGIQEIVDQAGVTKPTLYHYFGSKLGLLEALLAAHFSPLQDELERAARYRRDLPQTLSEIARAYFAFALARPDFYRLQLGLLFAPLESDGLKAVTRFHERQFRLVEEMFRAAAADHGNMKGRQRAYAVTFIGMIHNYVVLALNGHGRLDDKLLHQAVQQFSHGIYS
jgi:AcrR family transcriptional regulator